MEVVNFKKYNSPRNGYTKVSSSIIRIICREHTKQKQGNYYIAIPTMIVGENNYIKFGNMADGTLCFVMQKKQDDFTMTIKPPQKRSNYRIVYNKELIREITMFFRKDPANFRGLIEIEQVYGVTALKRVLNYK